MKEHRKLYGNRCQEVSKTAGVESDHAFCLGPPSEKKTNSAKDFFIIPVRIFFHFIQNCMLFVPLRMEKSKNRFFFQIPLRLFTERRDFLCKNRVLDMVCRMCLSQFWTSKKNSFTGKGRGLNERPPRKQWKGKSRWPQLGKTFMLDLFLRVEPNDIHSAKTKIHKCRSTRWCSCFYLQA